MELVKPDPLIMDGKAHYTLTSYDPVSVEVDVPRTTDEDVTYAMQVTILQAGGGPAQLFDDLWIREHLGVANADELRAEVRNQLDAMNAHLVEEQKAARCADALASRLVQRVPEAQVQQTRQTLSQSFALSLTQNGTTAEEFFMQTGMRREEFEAMLDQQAQTSARHEAAIDAWATQRKITVSDEELPRYLGAQAEDAEKLLREVSAHGQLEQARQAAVRNKAMETVVAECACTYRHQTPEEAAKRAASMRDEQRAMLHRMEQQRDGAEGHPHLRLV